jgi:hypothetical protein
MLRKARFTDSESGKSSATSGSSTTILEPCAYLAAYFPRTPWEKSSNAG